MNKMVKMAMLFVALSATSSFASAYAFRVAFSLYDYSTGDSEEDKYVNIGYGFGGGLVTTVQLTSKLSFVSEFNFLYRKPVIFSDVPSEIIIGTPGTSFDIYLTEFAISIPIMFQLTLAESMPYLAAGIQLDTPIASKMTAKIKGSKPESKDYDDRVSLDLGIVLGVGYLLTPDIGVDARVVIGLTEPSKNGDDSWKQYGAGLTYYF